MKIDEFKKKFHNLKDRIILQGREEFHWVISDIFDKFPKLESFSWRQFTPYFNDGEPCEFRAEAYTENIKINGVMYEDFYEKRIVPGKQWPEYYLPDEHKWMKECAEIICPLLKELEPILQMLFGDHTNVTIYRDGSSATSEFTDHH